MKKIVSFVSILLVFAMLCTPTMAYANSGSDSNRLAQIDQDDALISELILKRASIFINETPDIAELNSIDMQLHLLGCTFLTTQEVDEMFPAEKADRDLALAGLAGSSSSSVQRVDPPSQPNVTWINHRSTYTYNGQVYNVQRLVAAPNQNNSNLKQIGTRTVTYNANYAIGTHNLIKSTAMTGLGLIPGATAPLALYDAVSSFVSGISRTSEVTTPHIAYTYSLVTTVCFTYVRLNNQTDDYQWLSHISSSTETTISTASPGFTYRLNSSGNWIANSAIANHSKTFYGVPADYFSVHAAVVAYCTNMTHTVNVCVTGIQISGPQDKSVEYIYPVYPQHPFHIY